MVTLAAEKVEGERERREERIHEVFERRPDELEKVLNIKIDPATIVHERPLGTQYADFVFQDYNKRYYVAEVKRDSNPLKAQKQVSDYVILLSKELKEEGEKVDIKDIQPVIIFDKNPKWGDAKKYLTRLNILVGEYDAEELDKIFDSLGVEEELIPRRLTFPDITEVESFLEQYKTLNKNFSDIQYFLEGCKGRDWWDGYYPFRAYWLWKRGDEKKNKEFFELTQILHRHLFEQRIDDCIWLIFIWAITDRHTSASEMHKAGWSWRKVRDVFKNKGKDWKEFLKFIDNLKFDIEALWKKAYRKQVISTYLEKVGDSQEKYFRDLIKGSKNPFEAYDRVYNDISKIKFIGRGVVGPSFATYLAEFRILPLIPTENIKISRFVKRAIDQSGIRLGREDYRRTISRLAEKYSVLPILIERVFHKLGRTGER